MRLSVVVPCYNEESTLQRCIERILAIADHELTLEIIVVDDCSKDRSLSIAQELASKYPEIRVEKHEKNQGKGAALRTGFQNATGDFVAVQDADLEYDPIDLKKLLGPLKENRAEVVLGSRFLTGDSHRVLFFWHSLGNRFLTLLSNMFTDLNLTDMETCYKVFRREVIQSINIEENRFGFEPEIVAKIASMRLRIFEMGISYAGRTYEEGKKIKVRDGFRALYCILRYNAHRAPLPIQFFLYIFIGGAAAIVDILFFLTLLATGLKPIFAAPSAFVIAAGANYLMCILLLFRHKAKWNTLGELFVYIAVVATGCALDTAITVSLIEFIKFPPSWAKLIATAILLIYNFLGRRFLVFPEKSLGAWKPQNT